MGNTWGRNITVTLFGESHGAAIGVTIGGLPPGFAVDWEQVDREMARRAPGGALSTQRREADAYEILSGFFNGYITGAPLTAIIRNSDTRSRDYTPNIMRPGHADYPAYIKYSGYNDYRGGGHFSGRLTAPLVFAGALAKQILGLAGVTTGARILKIAGITDVYASPEEIITASKKPFQTVSEVTGEKMRNAIFTVREDKDSVGGVIEGVAAGVPAGYGEPFFDALESTVAHMMFAIPAVKGVEFGGGFALADMRGSEANDAMCIEDEKIVFLSNNNGGITGGITNGQAINVKVAVKPTPTVGKPQSTVDVLKNETVTAEFGGRHDPCIVPRAVPVVEAALALCLLDCMNIK